MDLVEVAGEDRVPAGDLLVLKAVHDRMLAHRNDPNRRLG
jgi:hypothetical protein